MFRRALSRLNKLLGRTDAGTFAPPVRTSVSARHLNRFRPALETCEDRTVPTVVTIAALADATEGGATGAFRVTRTGTATELSGSLYATVWATGTATRGVDYAYPPYAVYFAANQTQADVYVGEFEDGTSEPTETITWALVDGTGYTIGAAGEATIDLLDNDAQVVTVAAAADAVEGGASGTFRFTRTGDLSGSLTVNYTVTGTATSGTDFTSIGTSVTFAASAATADVSVAALTDTTYDPDETVVVTLASGTGYSAGTANTDEIIIVDSASLGFTLGSNVGTANYTIPWSSVDETLASQSLSLTGFTLTLAGQTFTPYNATFTTAPTVQFEYGVFVGITFAIDTSTVLGYAYTSVSMSGSTDLKVTAIDAVTLQPVFANAKAKPEVGVTKAAVGTQQGSVDVTFSFENCKGAKSVKVYVYDSTGKMLLGGSLPFPVTKDKGGGVLTGTTANVNTNVLVVVEVLDGNNKTIVKTAGFAAITK